MFPESSFLGTNKDAKAHPLEEGFYCQENRMYRKASWACGMDFFSNIYIGFSVILAPANLFFCVVEVLIGTLIGVLPALSSCRSDLVGT
jgi:hypothetical protein